jgi:ATP/ADP translocase/HEAT repeat protein
MGVLVAVLLGAYTIAKVLRDSLFISQFGARALPYGYVGVAIASVALIKFERLLSRYFPHFGVVPLTQLFAIAFSVAAALILPMEKQWLAAAFYVWSGSQGMILLSHFWLLAQDVWDSHRAQRVFPLLTGFGLAGGMAAGAFANLATPHLGLVGLLWCLAGLLVLVRVLTAHLAAQRHFKSLVTQPSGGESRVKLVTRSPLLRYLVGSIALSVVASTLIDFQFKQMAQEAYPDRLALAQFLGLFHAGLDGFAILAQFGFAGWILRQAGVGLASAVQPTSVLLFAGWMMISPGWWAVLALRWIQGVLFQTVGKSVVEINFTAVRPFERRRIKSAIDVVVERGADALVGVLLIVILHAFGTGVKTLAGLTAVVAAVWFVVQLGLKREYTRAFRDSLAARWIEPQVVPGSLRVPEVRQAILEALRSDIEAQVVTALELCRGRGYPDVNQAVRDRLQHPSARVRVAAVRAMEALGLEDSEGAIRSYLSERDEGLRRAAVEYLLSRGWEPTRFTRQMLEGDDRALRKHALDVLITRPNLASGSIRLTWIDQCIESGDPDDLVAAGQALGRLGGRAAVQRLHLLLRHPNLEARRSALRSAALRPDRSLLEAIVPLLFVSDLAHEASEALAAVGDASVPVLRDLVTKSPDPAVRKVAAYALARVGTPASIAVLTTLARNQELSRRYLGLRNLNRVRRDLRRTVVPRSWAHRMFLRELGDYRGSTDRAAMLDGRKEPEVRLLADSYRESADWALNRAFRALACWYEPSPLEGAFRGLRSGEREGVARGLEYLRGILPRKHFGSVLAFFETRNSDGSAEWTAGPDKVAQCIWRAWESGDGWLRACAMRAARVVPQMELSAFTPTEGDDPFVTAEFESLSLAIAEKAGLNDRTMAGGPAASRGVAC